MLRKLFYCYNALIVIQNSLLNVDPNGAIRVGFSAVERWICVEFGQSVALSSFGSQRSCGTEVGSALLLQVYWDHDLGIWQE